MPSSTPNFDLPYMVDSDPLADIATIMQTLSERIALVFGGGWVPITGDAATGFAQTGWEYQQVGPLIAIRGAVTNNTGAAITMGATGNIADVTVCDAGHIPAALSPSGAGNESPGFVVRCHASGSATFFGRIQTDGSFVVTHGQPGAGWANGSQLWIQDVYAMTTPPNL